MDMGLDGQYDRENIFAKMVRGEFNCHKVYEDEYVLSFMDAFPQARGHVLVVPKIEARNLLDIAPEDLAILIQRVQKIAKGVKSALNPDGISMFQFSGAAGGQSVFHLHFHIVPRVEGALLKGHGTFDAANTDELAQLAKEIGAAII
jgi:histidine triad (HIT) family protein